VRGFQELYSGILCEIQHGRKKQLVTSAYLTNDTIPPLTIEVVVERDVYSDGKMVIKNDKKLQSGKMMYLQNSKICLDKIKTFHLITLFLIFCNCRDIPELKSHSN
jgi:hypothetical protein